jgi:Protein of unknown function (DUF3152)
VAVVAAVQLLDGGDAEPDPPVTTATASTRTTAEGSTTTRAPTTTTTTAAIDPDALVPTDRFAAAPGGSATVGRGPLFTYVVEVEEGVPVDPAAFAAAVDATLADPRGWTAAGDVALRRVGADADPSFRVRLATPATVDAHCAPLVTAGIYSCRQGDDVMINARRWLEGADASQMPLPDYRHYVISHEVGHALGHSHAACPAPGAVAPVMLQQTKGLQGCRPNPWPYPDR